MMFNLFLYLRPHCPSLAYQGWQADTQYHGTADHLGDVEEGEVLEGVVLLAQQGLESIVVVDIHDGAVGQLVQLHLPFLQHLHSLLDWLEK